MASWTEENEKFDDGWPEDEIDDDEQQQGVVELLSLMPLSINNLFQYILKDEWAITSFTAFLYSCDLIMSHHHLGWQVAQSNFMCTDCHRNDFWVQFTGPRNISVLGCTHCNTPRIIFTLN